MKTKTTKKTTPKLDEYFVSVQIADKTYESHAVDLVEALHKIKIENPKSKANMIVTKGNKRYEHAIPLFKLKSINFSNSVTAVVLSKNIQLMMK
jgi:hypothetical protein